MKASLSSQFASMISVTLGNTRELPYCGSSPCGVSTAEAENVFDSGVQVIEGTDIYLVIARSAVEVEYDLQPLACFSERLSAPLGALTLGAALGPVADLLNGVYREHYRVWEARALGAAPEDIPESYGGAIPTRVQSVQRRVDSKILIRLVPE